MLFFLAIIASGVTNQQQNNMAAILNDEGAQF